MKKFNVFFNVEKEEEWLNEHLQKGYRCVRISGLGIYTFRKTNKRYVMRLDYQDYLSSEAYGEYRGLYEDFGWSNIKGSRFGTIQYWQKEAGDQDEIFSDRQSKRNYYKRLMSYSFILGMLCLAFSYTPYKDPALYHEGLWSMKGALFWKAFVFETPFVLLKLLPTFMFVLLAINFSKAYRKVALLKEK